MALISAFIDYFKRDKRLLLHLIIFLVSGFLLLTLFVLLLPPSVIDIELSEELQEHQNPLLDGAMKLVSWFGKGLAPVFLVFGTALIFYLARYRREAIFTLATLLSGVVIYGLKAAVNRPRPTADLVTFVTEARFQSFPSGHVAFYVVFFGFLTYLMYRLADLATRLRLTVAVFSLLLIFSVPFSRVYLGAHWFTDVLAGFIIGLLCLIGLVQWYTPKPVPE